MSTQEELYARFSALWSKAGVKADAIAIRTSVLLSRIVFIGVLLLPAFEPNSFYIVRAGRLNSPPEVELHARLDVPAAVRSIPAAPTSVGDRKPSTEASDTRGPNVSTADTSEPNISAASPPGPNIPAAEPPAKSAVPAVPSAPPVPTDGEIQAKPVPPAKQVAPPWTDEEVASAKKACGSLLAKMTVISEELPPEREGICGAPAPRLLKSVGQSKVKIEPAATLNCKMIAGMNDWIVDKLQPAAQKNFGSPIVRVLAESYSCRNRYGLARAPISEHALMNAVDVSGFVLADGKVIRVSKNWGPTADDLKKAQKSSQAETGNDAKFQVAASKLGAHDIAKKSDDKDKDSGKPKAEDKPKEDEKQKTKSPEALKEEQAKQAMSAFLHEAHDGACDIFGTVLGPETNAAHRDHFHLDMKERRSHRALCE